MHISIICTTSATLLNRTVLLHDLVVPESSLSVPEVILGFLMGI